MKLFVWDLHGTLEQGNERAAIEMSNRILATFGYSERFNESHTFELYGLKWYQYFEHLLPQESADRHFELQAACFEFSNSSDGAIMIASYMKPSPNAIKTLAAIAKSGHEQALISNTVPESVPYYVQALGMGEFFDHKNAIAVDQHSKGSKRTKLMALQDYIEGKAYDQIVVIGDPAGDMVLADEIGATGYLYSHPGYAFRTDSGEHKINDLSLVLGEIE